MEDNSTDQKSENDATPKVTGIGGIFFFSDDPNAAMEWYGKNLGLDVSPWGAKFESRNIDKPEQINALAWTPFKKGSDYFSPSTKEVMINYTVQHIEELVIKLKENGVTVLDEITSSDYGKFVHIMDHEGNKLELWEPGVVE